MPIARVSYRRFDRKVVDKEIIDVDVEKESEVNKDVINSSSTDIAYVENGNQTLPAENVITVINYLITYSIGY